ncbi:MAG: caspase family protein [Planctomycetes bacterium]|nr:caspase family protein [Planctomycetota bacterium]
MQLSMTNSRPFIALLVLLAPTTTVCADEASRVRILIVADTESKSGSTWKRDGENIKDVLEAGFKRQKLTDRATIDLLTGKEVTPENVLDYYGNFKTDGTEALLFYFSGHGSIHAKRGHFLGFLRGNLYRDELISAMKKHNPRLIVLLTDTCANYMSGGYATNAEPPDLEEGPTKSRDSPQEKVRRDEPADAALVTLEVKPRQTYPKAEKAKTDEPSFRVQKIDDDLESAKQPARVEEPPGATVGMSRRLMTGSGQQYLQEILDNTDGLLMRELLFGNRGFVDINACKKGTLSHGQDAWGGSLFTNSLLALQKEYPEKKSISWDEFFPLLRARTKATARKVSQGEVDQEPELFSLARPSVK